MKKEENNEPKKQKAGLGAIRPADYVENEFKKMAADKKISQTEMFEYMFWNFISGEEKGKKEEAISYESELSLISTDLNNVLSHIKSITEKAQNTVMAFKTNSEQTEKNLKLELDTLSKKIEEIKKRNLELEHTNQIFNDVKSGLDSKIAELNELLEKKSVEIKEHEILVKEQYRKNKESEMQNSVLQKENTDIKLENKKILEQITADETKIKSLEVVNANFQSTINNIEMLKKAEISAIDEKYKTIISELNNKVKSYDDAKVKEVEEVKNRIITEMDAERKLSLAEAKLELVDMKNKYNELLISSKIK
ncbi:hypothetical protein [Clostridium peptidivorans]|uniref:hypothetical protein n=1 Tax=Clostridium peptidivorans TaxID=100174 RepID=UPI000BE31FF2|nr:hypothetical protein [Clostridium peptidivorans]